MFHKSSRLVAFLLAPLLLSGGCGKADPTSQSQKSRVKAKSGAVWGRDLANALGLQEWKLCSELGSYDCIAEAHRITLGGVEPTVLGIDQPLPNASASAPIAVDRVAISACSQRFDLDQAGSPVLFGPVIQKDSPAARTEVSENLIRRILARNPDKAEVDGLVELHQTLQPLSKNLVRDWSVGACVVVATSTESLFY